MTKQETQDLMSFIQELRTLMADRSHSSRKLSIRLGMTQPQVSRLRRLDNGSQWSPSGETLIKIAGLLGKKIILVPDKD